MSQVSEKKLAANRANARRSTGPITPEGKAASRANALVHGLTANVVAVPGEDQAELDAMREEWVGEVAQKSGVAAQFADLAFRALVRRRRVDRTADAAALSRARRAEAVWTIRRAEEVKAAIDELSAAPSVAVARLKSTAEGARWLKTAWEALDYTLDAGAWGEGEYNRALELLGIEQVGHLALFDDTNALVRTADLCRRMGGGHDYRTVSEAALRAREKDLHVDLCLEFKAASDAAYARVKKLVSGQIRETDALSASLAPLSAVDRDDALALCMVDDSKEGVLLRRYQAAADRELHRNYRAALQAEAAEVETAAPEPESVSTPVEAAESPLDAPARNEPKPQAMAESPAPNEPKAEPAGTPVPLPPTPKPTVVDEMNTVRIQRPPSRRAI